MIVDSALLKLRDNGWSDSFLRRPLPYIYIPEQRSLVLFLSKMQHSEPWKIRISHFYLILNIGNKAKISIFFSS